MSWCDKLASVPTVGFKFDARLTSGITLLEVLAPAFAENVTPEAIKFTVDDVEAFSTNVTTENGFRYMADTWRVAVGFGHKMKAKPVSGGPPVLEMMSRPLPYTELLEEVTARTISAALLLPDIGKRRILRAGVVSATQVDEGDLPPGIARMVEYMGRPWSGGLNAFQMQLESVISEEENWTDKCTHFLSKSNDATQLMTIQFDYGREFKTDVFVDQASLKRTIKSTSEAALEYLEDIAQGSRFDEELIGNSVESQG